MALAFKQRRWMLVTVASQLILDILVMSQGGCKKRLEIDGIPVGSEVVRMSADTQRDAVVLTVEHPSFGLIPEGGMIPYLDYTIHDKGGVSE